MTSLNGFTFTWNGRRLAAAASSNSSISYTYNHNGIRTSKTVNGTTTYYVVDENNNVVKQYELVNGAETNVIEFVYDSDNSPVYFTYNNSTYYYEKNMQGDIVGILDTTGNTVVKYTYDIWGKLLGITGMLSDTVGAVNPLRYRGYYYDTETGLYYLQSRYYSPDLMRFISRDDPALSNAQGEPLGSNLYVYCLNNPVMNSDPTGEILISTCVLIGIGIGAVIGGLIGSIYGYKVAKKMGIAAKNRWKFVVGYGLGGVIIGGVVGGFMGYGIGFLCGASSTSGVALKAISKAIKQISKKSWSHIITKEHAWNLVLKKVTQNNVKNIISTALKKGVNTLVKKQINKGVVSMVYECVCDYMGKTIVIHYAVVDGILKISDAWVKTR